MIFNKHFIDHLPAVTQGENPWVISICKMEHNKQLMKLMEKWFLNIPDNSKPKFLARLQSQKNNDFIPAFYELAMHQFCIEEGWQVKYEPTLPSGYTPDLFITTDRGYEFVLDVTTLFDNQDYAKANDKKIQLTRQISTLKTKHTISLHYLKLPAPSGTPKPVIKQVEKWLNEVTENTKKCKKIFNIGGYNIEVEILPKIPKPKNGCIFIIQDPGLSTPDYTNRIKSSIDDKRTKYSSKKTNLPLVIMVGDAVGLIRADETAIDKALFGQLQITSNINVDNTTSLQRDRSGYFTPSLENNEWRGKNTGVSAIMYGSIKEKGSLQMQLFHNPLPYIMLDPKLFEKMPQLLVFNSTNASLQMKWVISNPQDQRIHFS